MGSYALLGHKPKSNRTPLIICFSVLSAIIITSLLLYNSTDITASSINICAPFSHSGDQDYLVGMKDKTGETKLDRYRIFKSHFPPLRPASEHGFPPPSEGEEDNEKSLVPDFDWPGIKTMIAFGDSFTTNYRNLSQQGLGDGRPETMWHLDHRLTDRVWPDWLWAMFKDTRTTHYYNIARPGATVARHILPPGKPEWGTLEDQLDDFDHYFTAKSTSEPVSWDPETTLFLIFFGINDISQLDRKDEGEMPIQATCQAFAHSLFEQSQRLYDQGARHFLYLNAHPFYRSPKYTLPHGIGHDIYDRVVDSVTWFNEAFVTQIEGFRNKVKDANIMDFDLFRFIDMVLDEPEMFGLSDTQRFEMVFDRSDDAAEVEFGQLGFAFRDFQHLSWNVHNLIARSLNGLLLRKSTSFTKSNATEEALYVEPPQATREL